ncbi:MAG: GNAT family N-acetyltransferase [Chloroflexi bacterium]|nr:GNAT family N-acetyltransferase [Chloroflexota bacterium]
MPENIQITLETEPQNEAAQLVLEGLRHFNDSTLDVGDDHYQPLHLIVRDATGVVVGGLLADTYWGWMAINILWLHDDWRGQGVGSRMLKLAEDEAIRRGCLNAYVDTMDFQAPEFYQKYGYIVFGQLDNMPTGHSRYYLRKTLA